MQGNVILTKKTAILFLWDHLFLFFFILRILCIAHFLQSVHHDNFDENGAYFILFAVRKK